MDKLLFVISVSVQIKQMRLICKPERCLRADFLKLWTDPALPISLASSLYGKLV